MEPAGSPARAGIASYHLPVKQDRSHTVEDVGPRGMPMQGRIALLGPVPEKRAPRLRSFGEPMDQKPTTASASD